MRVLILMFVISRFGAGATTDLYYSLLFSGFGPTTVTAMAVDATGNVYLTGGTEAADFPTTSGVLQPVFGGGTCETGMFPNITRFTCSDVFVVKLDPNGSVVFSTYLGGIAQDLGTAITTDAAGDIYVAGLTSRGSSILTLPHSDFPTTPGALFRTGATSGFDGFVAKLNSTGTALLYSTLIPGAVSASLALDSQGAIYFAGTGGSFAATSGAFQTAQRGGVIAKWNATDGSDLIYASYLGGSQDTSITGIAVDAQGNAFVAGSTNSPDFPATAGAFQSALPGIAAAFVAKLNPTGSSLVYATYLGGSSADAGGPVRVDAQGNAHILGTPQSTNFPVTPDAFEPTLTLPAWGVGDASNFRFVSALNADGSSLIYSTYFDDAAAFDVDAAGNAYITGQAFRGFPVTPGAFQRCLGGGQYDAFLAQLNPQGRLAGASYLGGSGADGPGAIPDGYGFGTGQQAIAAGSGGAVYAAGGTNSPDFPGAGRTPSGTMPLFVSKLRIADPTRADTPCLSLALQNAASYQEGPIAPGELVTLRGVGFGPDAGAGIQVGANGEYATGLAGVQVLFDGVAAPLLYVQSEQINAQAPWSLASGASTQVQVTYNGALSNTAAVPVADAAPAIFHLFYDSAQGAILNQDGSVNSDANPAHRGDIVAIFGTGGGLTSPLLMTGFPAPLATLARITQPVLARFGGIPGVYSESLYAGGAPGVISGVFQINVRIPDDLPASAGPDAFVNLTIGTAASTDIPTLGTTVAVQ